MKFEWDSAKAASNRKKHGVDFADAVGVFEDGLAITIEDQDAEGERRFITIGMDFTLKILVVVYASRVADVIRIISARKATKTERQTYEKGI
ncbi:MAG: BrnT family toxin [Geobacter sp.]|nr:BrnT family toxin [Geobacter sp.]